MSFAKNLTKSNGENVSKSFSSKYSQKLLDHAEQSATESKRDRETASKRVIQQTAEATGGLIGNTIADKITKISKTSSQASLEAVAYETENIGFHREVTKERRQKKMQNYWGSKIHVMYNNGISKSHNFVR